MDVVIGAMALPVVGKSPSHGAASVKSQVPARSINETPPPPPLFAAASVEDKGISTYPRRDVFTGEPPPPYDGGGPPPYSQVRARNNGTV